MMDYRHLLTRGSRILSIVFSNVSPSTELDFTFRKTKNKIKYNLSHLLPRLPRNRLLGALREKNGGSPFPFAPPLPRRGLPCTSCAAFGISRYAISAETGAPQPALLASGFAPLRNPNIRLGARPLRGTFRLRSLRKKRRGCLPLLRQPSPGMPPERVFGAFGAFPDPTPLISHPRSARPSGAFLGGFGAAMKKKEGKRPFLSLGVSRIRGWDPRLRFPRMRMPPSVCPRRPSPFGSCFRRNRTALRSELIIW